MSPSEATGFETRGGSADSGQSSSPGTNSSRGSIVDSLEEQPGVAVDSGSPGAAPTLDEKVTESSPTRLDADDAQTIKNYQAAEETKSSRNKNNEEHSNNNNDSTLKTTEYSAKQQDISGAELQVSPDVEHAEQPLKSALVNSDRNSNHNINNNNNNINNNNETPQVDTKTELHEIAPQQQKQTLATKNTLGNGLANNYSGLNLNMTASEMRELISRRKKFDPKKAQMNIRQKYEIIQQM